jgi:hypothetical protein
MPAPCAHQPAKPGNADALRVAPAVTARVPGSPPTTLPHGLRYHFACLTAFIAIAFGMAPPCARGQSPDDWYYREGALAGSLRSDQPLPLYDDDPGHLWNRLFATLYIRASELPSRSPDSPEMTLYERDLKMRAGKVPPGPVVRRIEGGDVMEFPAWPRTRYYSEPATFERVDKLLDEFLGGAGEKLIVDPVKRVFFQHDLWAVFDYLINQNIARYGDADMAKRRSDVRSYVVAPEDLQWNDPPVFARRETLCRKLAVIIRRLALPKATLEALPDNYAAAVQSGRFVTQHEFDPRRDYLPPGLLTQPGEWVEIDAWPGPIPPAREGQLTLHSVSFRARSYFRIFWHFPGGRKAVEEYLGYLRREGMDWQKTAEQGFGELKSGLRQIDPGTEVALVQCLMALDDQLRPVPTRLVGEVRLRIYKNVDGARDLQTSTGRGMNVLLYVTRRRLLFDHLQRGGLEREPDDLPIYRVFLQEGVIGQSDWGRYGRQQSVAQSCVHCHMYSETTLGVYGLGGVSVSGGSLEDLAKIQGVGIPLNVATVHYLRGERESRWKLGQEDYLRLVELAR